MSPLLQHRIEEIVPARKAIVKQAILVHDFDEFARIAMRDSSQFYVVCLGIDPPIFCTDDVSRAIIAFLTEHRCVSTASSGKLRGVYTYDAARARSYAHRGRR